MNEHTVFKLQPVVDNPVFEGFGTGEQPSLIGKRTIRDDFFPLDRHDWNWSLVPLTPVWQPLQVMGRVMPFNDYPCIAMMIPAFSKRAVDGLRDMLEPNGEILPLVHEAGEFYAYNCTTIAEVLDHDRTIASWMSKQQPCPAISVRYFAVIPERLKGLTIFRMREWSTVVFVTNVFAERAQALGLNGFDFVKVWPFPEGVDYKMEEAKRRRERGQKVVSPTGLKEVKAESLVIEFPLSEGKITAAEKKAISRFQNELDAQLVIHHPEDIYFGSLEGRKTIKGKTRLVLSCPDCDALVQKLKPWLDALQWPVKPTVLLRHGSWDDTAVEEISHTPV